MPWNGAGVFSRLYSWVTDYGNGLPIEPPRMDADSNDIANAFNNCVTRDGQGTFTANVNFNNFKGTNLAVGTNLTDSASLGQVQNGGYAWATSVAGTNTITANLTPAITAYVAGQRFAIVLANSIIAGGAVTINLNGLGAKNATKLGGTALAAGDGLAGGAYEFIYDGTEFQLLGTVNGVDQFPEISIASAATTMVVGGSPSGNLYVTGNTGPITAFDTVPAGVVRKLRFASNPILTYNAVSMILPSAANIQVSAGDCAEFESLGGGNWVCRFYQLASGTALVASGVQLQSVSASVGSNALTVGYAGGVLQFRNAMLTNGAPVQIVVPTLTNVVGSSATLGTIAATQAEIALIVMYNGGTPQLGVVNMSGGVNLDETTLISSTAGGGGSSASTVYSTTAVTNSPFRVVGYILITEAVAGTWATAPSLVQGQGGQALAAMQSLGMGQTWQNVSVSRAVSTTYYNTTGKPIFISIGISSVSANTTFQLTVNGSSVATGLINSGGIGNAVSAIVPTGGSYSATNSAGTPTLNWFELR